MGDVRLRSNLVSLHSSLLNSAEMQIGSSWSSSNLVQIFQETLQPLVESNSPSSLLSLVGNAQSTSWIFLQRLLRHPHGPICDRSAAVIGSAAAAAAAVLPQQARNVCLAWMIAQLTDPSSALDNTRLALIALLEAINSGPNPPLHQYLPSLLQSCLSLLEDDSTPPQLLHPLLQVLQAMATHYPRAVLLKFDDLVDLLLGWALDPRLTPTQRHLILSSFLHMAPLWGRAVLMAQRMLNRLLAEMEDALTTVRLSPNTSLTLTPGPSSPSMASRGPLLDPASTDLPHAFDSTSAVVPVPPWGSDQEGLSVGIGPRHSLSPGAVQPQPQAHTQTLVMDLNRMESLAACFAAVLCSSWRGLAYLGVELAGHSLTLLAGSMLQRWTASCTTLVAVSRFNASACIKYACQALYSFATILRTGLRHYQGPVSSFFSLCLSLHPLPSSLLLSLLQCQRHVLICLSGEVSMAHARQILEGKSGSVPHLRLHCSKAVVEAVAQLYALLLTHSNPAVVECSRGIMVEECEAMSALLCSDPVGGDRKAVPLLKFNLKALALSFKHRPGLWFDGEKTFMTPTQLLAPPFCHRVDLQLSLLDAILQLQTEKQGQQQGALFSDSRSRAMADVMRESDSVDVKTRLLDWVGKVSGSSKQGIAVPPPVFHSLLSLSSDEDTEVRGRAAWALQQLLAHGHLTHQQILTTCQLALRGVTDADPSARESYQRLAHSCTLPAAWLHNDIAASSQPGSSSRGQGAYEGGVEPQFLIAVVNSLGMGSGPPSALHQDWLSRQWARLGAGDGQEPGVGSDFRHYESTSVKWAVQEASRQLVASRLKTHLGGATATLAALERALLPGGVSRLSPLYAFLLPEFVDAVERQASNVYLGSVGLSQETGRAPVPSSSSSSSTAGSGSSSSSITPAMRTFFTTNRKVCEEWFGRMRPGIVSSARATHNLPAVVRAGTTRLLETVDAGEGGSVERDQVMVQLADAMCRMGDRHGLEGLLNWVQDCCPAMAAHYMPAVIEVAKGRYEAAGRMLNSLLSLQQPYPATTLFPSSPLSEQAMDLCLHKLAECSLALDDKQLLMACQQHAERLGRLPAGISAPSLTAAESLSEFESVPSHQSSALFPDPMDQCQHGILAVLSQLKQHHQPANAAAVLSSAIAYLEPQIQLACLQTSSQLVASLLFSHSASSLLGTAAIQESVSGKWLAAQMSQQDLDPESQRCAPWLTLLRACQLSAPSQPWLPILRLKLARLSRKQGNLQLAESLLSDASQSQQEHTHDLANVALLESVKLRWTMGDRGGSTTQLWDHFSAVLSPSQTTSSPSLLGSQTTMAKLFCTLSKWLHLLASSPSSQDAAMAAWVAGHVTGGGSGLNTEAVLEEASRKVSECSVRVCRGVAVAWLRYASWCLGNARRQLLLPCAVEELALGGSHGWQDILQLPAVMTLATQALSQAVPQLAALGDEGSAWVNSLAADCWKMWVHGRQARSDATSGCEKEIARRIEKHPASAQLQEMPPLDSLFQLWDGILQIVLDPAKEAMAAYMKCLALSPDTAEEGKESLPAAIGVWHCLLLAGQYTDVEFKQGVEAVKSAAWQPIIPLLMASMGRHKHPTVRQQLLSLGTTLVTAAPSSLLYPLLVESLKQPTRGPEVHTLLDRLVHVAPDAVGDTRTILREFNSRLAVLWEEQWVALLQELQGYIAGHGKSGATMAVVVRALEKQLSKSGAVPTSPYESSFHAKHQKVLSKAVEALRRLVDSEAGFDEVAQVWRNLQAHVARMAKHQSVALTVGQLSSVLGQLTDSQAPMPGCCEHPTVKIFQLEEEVRVLGTKTRPKRLTLVGSDGRRYPYLLKGQEDLQLDARIMSVLQLLHGKLTGKRRSLGIRHYSVTPIGLRAGLIQWVPAVVSLYSLYRAWQLRRQQQSEAMAAATAPVVRPTERYFQVLHRMLKESGMEPNSSRSSWPPHVKLAAFKELLKETPRQLLAMELWSAAEGTREWWMSQSRYADSVAVNSMVGYILGLGDRHLENILVDLQSGELMNIDYNVCFDKGLTLRIPEVVPFRLTAILQGGLPIGSLSRHAGCLPGTGTGNGSGRRETAGGRLLSGCATTLQCAHKHRQTILSLLSVFVWDPLPEWGSGGVQDSWQDDATKKRASTAGLLPAEVEGSAGGLIVEGDEKDEWLPSRHGMSGTVSLLSAMDEEEEEEDADGEDDVVPMPNGSAVKQQGLKESEWELDGSTNSVASKLQGLDLDDKLSQQKGCAHGMEAMAHVKEKLNLDVGDGEHGVLEVVHGLIGKAASEAILCEMYEGWTPWI